MAIKKKKREHIVDIKCYQKNADSKKYFFSEVQLHLLKKKKQQQKEKKKKAFTRSDQLLPFLINLVCTLPIHAVSLEYLAVVLIHKEMSLQEFNWFVIF